MKRSVLPNLAILAAFFLFTACGESETVAPTPSKVKPTGTAGPTRTLAPPATLDGACELTPSPQQTPTRSPFDFSFDVPTPTPPVALEATFSPAGNPALIGGTLPEISEAIGAGNIERLNHVAEWGRGYMRAVAFAQDGDRFAVGTIYGLAIYEVAGLASPPRWIPFDEPAWYEKIYFDSTGRYMRLEGGLRNTIAIIDLDTGEAEPDAEGLSWYSNPSAVSDYIEVRLDSPDGSRRFEGYHLYESYDEETEEMIPEGSERRMKVASSGETLYDLKDWLPLLTIEERTEPEGCSIHFFSPCGNASAPLSLSPYKVSFSPDGRTFAVNYRPPSLYNSAWYSTLRVYDTETGELLGMIGSYEDPVQDFEYAPDSKTLLVGYLLGSVLRWDIQADEAIFGAQHFSTPVDYLGFSPNGEYILTMRQGDSLEIRRTRDGGLRGRYDATAFAVSPTQNAVAIGEASGYIRIIDIDSGATTQRIEGHTAKVLSLAYSPDGKILASSGQDCRIQSWVVNTGAYLHDFEETSVDPYGWGVVSEIFVHYMRFLFGTDNVIGFGSWATVVNWNANSGATQYVIESPPLDYYHGMFTIKPHFPEFFSVDLESNSFFINELQYDLESGEQTGVFEAPAELAHGCAPSGPISKDGKLRFTRGYESREGQVCVLDRADNNLILAFQVTARSAEQFERVEWVFLSPDGGRLYVLAESGVIFVYQIGEGA